MYKKLYAELKGKPEEGAREVREKGIPNEPLALVDPKTPGTGQLGPEHP